MERQLEALRSELRHIKRMCQLSAALLRDPKRTGGWAGARRTAEQFDRIAGRAAQAVADSDLAAYGDILAVQAA